MGPSGSPGGCCPAPQSGRVLTLKTSRRCRKGGMSKSCYAEGRALRYVAWRDYASPMLMAKSASKRFIWLHDTVQVSRAGKVVKGR